MDTLKNDIQELKILFNTSPKLYEKADFQKLIHVIEHLAAGGQDQPDPTPDPTPTIKDHPQYRNDIENHAKKVNKKGKIKFTDDGYAICDKASSQDTKFHTGERIWLNPATIWSTFLQVSDNTTKSMLTHNQIQSLIGEEASGHIVLFFVDAEGVWHVTDYGKFTKVFTYRLNSKYFNGTKEKVIVEKELKRSNLAAVAPEQCFEDVLSESGIIIPGTRGGYYLNKGIRIYTRHSQHNYSADSNFYDSKKHRTRFKYYRYGNFNSRAAKLLSSDNPQSKWTHFSRFDWLKEYLLGRALAFPRGVLRISELYSQYIDCIVDHYQFKKGVTYRYKFRVYLPTIKGVKKAILLR